MRSFVRSLLLVAAVSTPLAAFAYGSPEGEASVQNPQNCDCCTGGAHASHHAPRSSAAQPTKQDRSTEQPAADMLDGLGSQNGWVTSFDSP